MNIIFMGTPEFAVPSLEMLIKEKYKIVGIITQPDKPKGRGHKLCMPPVKEVGLKNNLKVLQPDKVKTDEFLNDLKQLSPDLLITAAYGKILPKSVLEVPKYGCINVHASLLPKYRGAAPITWSIVNGETETGITTMYTDIGMDTGDILLKDKIEITKDMTAGELHDKLSIMGADVLKITLEHLKAGTLKRIPQDDLEASYAPMINKNIGRIDWSKPGIEIHNLIRGINPWPGAFCYYNKNKMNIWKSEFIQDQHTKDVGTICKVDKEGILVACKNGYIKVLEVQFASCRKLCISEYMCGHTIYEGEVLE